MRVKLTLFLLLMLSACELFDYHQLDGSAISKKDGFNGFNGMKLSSYGAFRDNRLRFVFVGDTHRNDNETKAFVRHINQRDDIDFVLHAGDITDFGLKNEYEWTHDILKKLDVPHIVAIGNHDIIGHGDLVYQAVYGPENFAFSVGFYRFIVLNTNRLEYRSPTNIPDFGLIDKQVSYIKANSYPDMDFETVMDSFKGYMIERPCIGTIILMHSPPYCEQFDDEEVLQRFSDNLLQIPNLYFCLHGHTHKHTVTEPLSDRVTYIGCDNIAKRTYLVFEITPEGYTYEVVHF